MLQAERRKKRNGLNEHISTLYHISVIWPLLVSTESFNFSSFIIKITGQEGTENGGEGR